jgi:annexin A7/11
MYGKDLVNELRSELHGDFEELILALMENPVKYDADQLYKAMARIGTRENVLIEIMTSRSNVQIFQLKQAYAQVYGRDLERDLVSETSMF